MHVFRLFDEDNITEGDFRWWYSDIEERVQQCCTFIEEDVQCDNDCRYLIAFDIDATRNGYPSVLGRNCDVEVRCWGGHSDETTVYVYCFDCAVRAREQEDRKRADEEHHADVLRVEQQREDSRLACAHRTLAEYWRGLQPLALEVECAELLRRAGFVAGLTARTNDGNIDVELERDGRRGAAQCKAWNKPCGVRIVREFLGTLHAEALQFGYLISISGFTPRATDLLRRLPMVEAWDLQKLVSVAGALDALE